MKKNSLLRKGSSVALVATLIGSQLIATVPFNVFATEQENPAGESRSLALPYIGVEVSNWAELKAALTNATITDIYFSKDITIGETTIVKSTLKNIHGNGFTLDANLKQIKLDTANTTGLMEDLKIKNTDIYGLFWGSAADIKVTYRDIEHNGRQMIYLPDGELIIEGTVSSNSTVEEVFQGKQLTIKDNANVNFVSSATGRTISPITFLYADGGLYVGKNATLKVRSNAATIYGGTNSTIVNYGNMDLESYKFQAIHLASKGAMYFQPGSVLKAVAGDPVEESVQANDGSIFVAAGATFEVEGNGTQGAVITGANFTLAEGSNFSITNFNAAGSALGTYTVPTNVTIQSRQGVSTWDRGSIRNAMPTASYSGALNANFTLSGYLNSVKQTNMSSNNAQFSSLYNTGKTGKITGGSFASKEISPMTIAKLDSDATFVVGTAEAGSDVVIKVGTTIIGQGKADADGKFNIAIPKQAAGTNVTATASWNGQTSSATTVVQQGTTDQDLARKAIDELFTNTLKNVIKSTTDQASINHAQDLLDAVKDPTIKAALQKDLDHAQELLDAKNATEKARQEAAVKAVNELFNNNKPATDVIKDLTTQSGIDAAQELVDAVTEPAVKEALQKDLDRAQELLNEKSTADQMRQNAARKAVNALFNNNKPVTDIIKDLTTQSGIDAAQELVDTVTEPAVQEALQKDLDRAQELLNAKNVAEKARQDAARKAVNELFNSNKPATDVIKDLTTQEGINIAQELADTVTEPTAKLALQKDIDRAQVLLNARNAAEKAAQDTALKAVNALFTSNKPALDTIKGTTTQEAIDAAQDLLDDVTDPTVQAAAQKNLDRAQELLDAKKAAEKAAQDAASKAVNELFTNNKPSGDKLKETTTQAGIDAAQDAVDQVTDLIAKAEAQKNLDRAQELLDGKLMTEQARQDAALKAVNELFTNNKPATDTIKDTTIQAGIDVAQQAVDKVADPLVKAAVQKDLDRAQELLDAKNAAEKASKDAAIKAVNELFKGDTPATDVIKNATVQTSIDAAQKLVNAVADPITKAQLQKDLNRAQELLNLRATTVGTITPAEFLIGTDKYVTGMVTGDVAKISLLVNDNVYTGGLAKADGTFTFYANDKNLKKTDVVFVVAYDQNGKELSRQQVKFVVVTEGKITPATYNLSTDKNITGTYTGDVAKVTVTVGSTVYKGGTVINGALTFYSSDKIKNATDVVTVQAYDKAGKLLDTKTLKIIANEVVTKGSITLNELKVPGDKNITGTYTGDVNYIVVSVDGVDYKGGTFTDGVLKFYSFDKITSVSKNVTIKAYDKAGKLLDTETLELVGAEKPATPASLALNTLILGTDKNITGTYTGDVKSVEVTVNTTVYKGGTFTDGEFKFYSFDKIKSVTDDVTIKALDATGKVLITEKLQIVVK
ncbi:immunoglobulin-like domain-containing protein [Listeria rustica]|uniref:Cell wall anchor protein n=1 Tax=Listeria rustica TaxID=2713503 RepID=A0A7W1T941_9LIST|nr:immunoglobulin-like domain-containing protein [Listeria rustica]MBA3927763.1 hypothetical protein [Listeria rustica]